MSAEYVKVLENYMPKEAAELAAHWIIKYNFNLKITRARNSKLGDYRAPSSLNERHLITVNHNLNSYSFLITFVHEVAHLTTYNKYGNKVKAHGSEWKAEFRGLMHPYFAMNVFPDDVAKALIRYLTNPAASSCRDEYLQKVLRKYNASNINDNTHFLEALPINTIFIYNSRRFIKGQKQRKLYKCQNVETKHYYLFNPLTEVELVEPIP